MIAIVFRMDVGRKIAKWRSSQGLSQRAAAAKAGVSQAAWCALERGDFKRIGLEVARRVARVCDAITIEDFFAPKRRSIPPAA